MFPYGRLCVGVFLLYLVGCEMEHPSELATTSVGTFQSSQFVEPGPADRGIDIQQAGGYLQISLLDIGCFTAELFIPDTLSTNYPRGHTSYKGNFSVSGETILFSSSTFIVDSLRWDLQKEQLETFDVPLRGQPFKIVLEKHLR